MTQEQIDSLCSQYATLKEQKKELDSMIEDIGSKIYEYISTSPTLSRLDTEYGTFSLAKLPRKVEYSDKVANMKDELEALKAQEENDGIATITETGTRLNFKPCKD